MSDGAYCHYCKKNPCQCRDFIDEDKYMRTILTRKQFHDWLFGPARTSPDYEHFRDIEQHDEALRKRITELECSVLNQAADNLCWFDPATVPLPPKSEFLISCARFYEQTALKNGVSSECRTIAQLESKVLHLEKQVRTLVEALEIYAKPENWLCARCRKRDDVNCALTLFTGPVEESEQPYTRARLLLKDFGIEL